MRSTDSTDPYFDDNMMPMSSHSSREYLNVAAPALGTNMMRKVCNRDPYDVYKPAKLLGTGSMVCRSVYVTVTGFLVAFTRVLTLFGMVRYCRALCVW